MTLLNLLINVATVALCLSVLGCGHETMPVLEVPPTVADPANTSAPSITVTPTPTATPTPNPTVVTYIYQATTICAALKNWDPQTTTIKTYSGQANSETSYYLFRWDGVWFVTTTGCAAGDTSCHRLNTTITRSDIHGVVCTITVVNGELTGVTP